MTSKTNQILVDKKRNKGHLRRRGTQKNTETEIMHVLLKKT